MEKMSALSKLVVGVLLAIATLLVVVAFLMGCSHYQYRTTGTQKFRIEGRTANPESVAIALAEAEAIRAEAGATRICATNPQKCQAMLLTRMADFYGAGFLETPYGYTWAGIQTVQSYNNQKNQNAGEKEKTSGKNTNERMNALEQKSEKLDRRMKQPLEAVSEK